ncbi:trypsin-like serine peptidase [Streptomyces hundungensis]|uniref:trypsin-like serine peptidase n=1 Tax=Streptomyces hundungensis TaxID=1077946 RepID=UPI0033CB8CBA
MAGFRAVLGAVLLGVLACGVTLSWPGAPTTSSSASLSPLPQGPGAARTGAPVTRPPAAGPPGASAARYLGGLDGAGTDGAGRPRTGPERSAACAVEQRRPDPHDLRSACSYPVVGVFLRPGGRQSCTAAVVDSRHGDLLVTAAHCLPLDGATFAPGYHDGLTPRGEWPVLAALADPRYAEARKGAENWPYDWAFVRVARVGGRSVQEAVGSAFRVPAHPERLAADLSRVTLIGYPHDRPGQHTCTVDAQPAYNDFRQARCAGFSTGVSGSPWVISAQDGAGLVVGVLGGAERGGGFADDISYTARFDAGLSALFETAQGAGPRDVTLAP